ncbi:hypothetical protein FAZ15_01540 [Sphingobacterium olei]|uniref:Uncharacterized protein n=1 Tax=Sphingobacterium olei TaxID=2571155 RepID=A0A4V5MNW8_9SPHI|nr:hypothetical protein [Sphingobacterium olei]TJZ63008.1 hypothetical protein FAZ15_01540 [Sphingobacterium olei]
MLLREIGMRIYTVHNQGFHTSFSTHPWGRPIKRSEAAELLWRAFNKGKSIIQKWTMRYIHSTEKAPPLLSG